MPAAAICGSAPCARRPRWGVPLRRFVAHRVRSHRQASTPTRLAKADAQRGPALSPQRFGRVAQRIEVPAVWPPMGGPQQPSSGARAYPSTMLRALSGHFLWVTFDAKLVPWDLLGQQKKSDSSGGSRSKRPPRRRHAGLRATIEAHSHWIPAFAGMTSKTGRRQVDEQGASAPRRRPKA